MSDRLEALVRNANVVVHDDELDKLFGEDLASGLLDDVYAQREGRMSKQRQFEPQGDQRQLESIGDAPDIDTPTTRRARWVMVAPVFVAILALGAVAFTFASTSDDVAEADPPDPVSVAEAYIEARNAYDAEALEALLASDAAFSDWRAESAGYSALLAHLAALRGQIVEHECGVLPGASEGAVSCTYSYATAWSEALGVRPYDGGVFWFVVADGLVTHLTNTPEDRGYSAASIAFFDWMEENHSDEISVMFEVRGRQLAYTDEATALLAERTDEFVAEMSSG